MEQVNKQESRSYLHTVHWSYVSEVHSFTDLSPFTPTPPPSPKKMKKKILIQRRENDENVKLTHCLALDNINTRVGIYKKYPILALLRCTGLEKMDHSITCTEKYSTSGYESL